MGSKSVKQRRPKNG